MNKKEIVKVIVDKAAKSAASNVSWHGQYEAKKPSKLNK